MRPVWDTASSRVTGVEILPLAVLDRPRIDVTLRISGLFRDIFEAQIALFDMAVRRKVAALDEEDADNPLAAEAAAPAPISRASSAARPAATARGAADAALDGSVARPRASWAQAYLAGRDPRLSVATRRCGTGECSADRVSAGRRAGPSAGRPRARPSGRRRRRRFRRRLRRGRGAARQRARALPSRHQPTAEPKARTMAEEIARVVRGRLTNPRWISGMLDHGHRGVAEIAQGVDALMPSPRRPRSCPRHLFDATHAALIADEAVLAQMLEHNPAATGAIAARLHDALARGLWVSRRNSVARELDGAMTRAGAPPRAEAAQ